MRRSAKKGALVFPHTRLGDSEGHLAAAVALAVVRAGCDDVLALGILHGCREADATLVRRAREGAPSARASLHRVHGAGTPNDAGYWTEEFSLDGFCALVEVAAKREGKKAPRVVARYPFLGGRNQPGDDLPAMDELRAIVDRGAALVATADPIHHGAGYGAREEDRLPAARIPQTLRVRASKLDDRAEAFARSARADFGGLRLRHAAEVRSDFRDTGLRSWRALVDPWRSGRSIPENSSISCSSITCQGALRRSPHPPAVAAALAKFYADGAESV